MNFVIFDSNIIFPILTCGQNPNSKLRINTLQRKSLGIINNQPTNSFFTSPIQKGNIFKFEGKILINNIISMSNSVGNVPPLVFKCWFKFCSEIQNNDTVSSSIVKLFKAL